MRKPVFVMLFILSAGVICLLFFKQPFNPSRDSLIQERYVVGSINETIDEHEAEKTPPKERWHEIKDLKETVAIDVVCHPSSDQIVDGKTVSEIVDLLQESKYVEVSEYPLMDNANCDQ